MSATLRLATPGDVDVLFDIRTSVTQNHLSRQQMHALGITAEVLTEAISSAPCAWVVEWHDQPAGFAMVDLQEGELFALFVRPALEGNGLGTLLLQQAEQALFEHHAVIHLTTDGDPAMRANALYRRAGWVCTAQLDARDVRFEKHRPVAAGR